MGKYKRREKNLIKLMKSVGVLCEVVRTEKRLLKLDGYTDDDLYELESIAGQVF